MREGPEMPKPQPTEKPPGTDPARDGAVGAPSGSGVAHGLAHARQPIHPSTWLAVAAVLATTALRLWPLQGGSTEYDEGVYWQSLRAMSHGDALFSAIFSSQPPFFLAGIYPLYVVFGQALWAARLAIVLYALAGLAAIYVAGRALGGRVVGAAAVALVAVDPLYMRESYTLQAEIPALAFEMASVALALVATRRSGPRRHVLAAAAGGALGLGIGVKLFDVVALVPVALYLAAPAGAQLLGGEGRLRVPGRAGVLAGVRAAAPDLLACAAGALVALALVFLPFAGQWSALYDEVVRFHLAAAHSFAHSASTNVRLLARVGSELPLELLTALSVGLALARRRWAIMPPLLWAVASYALLIQQQPLFLHHVVLVVPALALTTAAAMPALAAALHALLARARSRVVANVDPRLAPWALIGLVLLTGLTIAFQETRQAARPPGQYADYAAAIAASTQPGDLIVSDDQYVVALADRDVPPELVDTSTVRIQSGYLTAAQLEAIVQRTDVRAVLFLSGRFDEVPGFREWVAARYTRVGVLGASGALYLKLPHAPPIV